MKSVSSPLALAYLNRALSAARVVPAPRAKVDSRVADKFVVRGYKELFEELKGIGRHQGRSMNSEAVAAILDALNQQARSTAMLNILSAYLGGKVSGRVLAEVPDFILNYCETPDSFVIRFPPDIREAVTRAAKGWTMNGWCLDALVKWINVQRQHYALLSAAIAMNPALIGADE